MRRQRWARRLRRMAGRQLARIGAGCHRRGSLAAAEASYRYAARLSAGPAWLAALAGIQEERHRWVAADASYTRYLALARPVPAERVRQAGVHHRQALVRVRLQDWSGAAASYQEAVRLQPRRPAVVVDLVQAYTGAGRPDLAATAGTDGLARFPNHGPLQRALLPAYQAVGDWPAAASLLRALVTTRPRDAALHSQLLSCLEWLHRLPPALTDPGAGDRRRVGDELAGRLRDRSELSGKAGDAHRLGLLYERTGRLPEAVAAYRAALARLTTVDAWWCHKAAYDWEFRLASVTGTGPAGAGHLHRQVAPAPGPAPDHPAGFVDALITRDGLQLSGFLLPGVPGEVGVYLDEQLVRRVRVDPTGWRRGFRYDLSPGLLGDFPETARLSVRAGNRPLVNRQGTGELAVHVPAGTGEIGRKLAAGITPTKKGTWPLTGRPLADRMLQYLELYERVRALLDGQGRRLFLSYGTLLGHQREGGFIAGDDDFDASYTSNAADPESFRQECRQVAMELLRQGLDVGFSINGRPLKIGLAGIWIDVTPTWFHAGRAWSFAAHDLSPERFEPVRAGRLLDRPVYLPADPAGFLADTYGPDWRTPQPQFRHYRSGADNRVLAGMWVRPSEVRELARLARAEQTRNGAAGRFAGVGMPAYPGFSWLVTEDGGSHPPAGPAVVTPGGPAAGVR